MGAHGMASQKVFLGKDGTVLFRLGQEREGFASIPNELVL